MRVAAVLLAGLVGAASAGCSSVAAAYERDASLAVEMQGGFRFDDPTVEESFKKAEQAVFPMRLAVYGLSTNIHGKFEDRRLADLSRLLDEDREAFSEVLPLPDFLAGARSLDVASLRRAAAQAHADALLLFQQNVYFDESISPLMLVNILLLPALFVPTTPYSVELDTRAALVDVRNGVVYLTIHDLRRGEGRAPKAYVDEWAKERKEEVRAEAFAALRDSLRAKLARLKERTEAGN